MSNFNKTILTKTTIAVAVSSTAWVSNIANADEVPALYSILMTRRAGQL